MNEQRMRAALTNYARTIFPSDYDIGTFVSDLLIIINEALRE